MKIIELIQHPDIGNQFRGEILANGMEGKWLPREEA